MKIKMVPIHESFSALLLDCYCITCWMDGPIAPVLLWPLCHFTRSSWSGARRAESSLPRGEATKAAVGADAPTTKPKISANNQKITMYAPPLGQYPAPTRATKTS